MLSAQRPRHLIAPIATARSGDAPPAARQRPIEPAVAVVLPGVPDSM